MGKGDKKGSGKPVTDDPRFSGVHSDPRFNLPGRKKGKVQLDERFKAAIRDNDDFKQKVTVDKYGRKVKQDKVQKELKKYANLSDEELEDKSKKSKKKKEEEEEEEEEEESGSEEESESESGEDSSDSEEEDTGGKVIDRARGEGLSDVSESSSEESGSDSSSSDDSSSSESESEEEEDEVETAGVVPSTDKAPTGDETTTFACVNMDWDNIRAVDLMATFSSFVPPKGKILSVKIYPSEYGKQQMQREEQEGPAREFFEKQKKKKHDSSDSEDEVTAKSLVEEDTGEEVNSSTLRKYQLQRLQYYYAVVTCDTVATARNIYDNCDGTEYESTANFFDLRYVPDGMTFDDEPRDQCEKIPADYKPNTFVTDALQHSKVKLTWDETPAERLKLAEKAFNQKDLDEMDFKAYLASDSDEDEAEDEEEAREKYRSLLGNVFERAKEEEDGNVEITFTPGLDEENKKGDENEEDRDETTIEKYKRKSKERKQARLERMKQKNQAENEEQPEPVATGKKAKKKAEAEARAKKTAELELLMMDDNATTSQAKPSEEGKKGKKKKAGKPQVEEADVNLSDPRFNAMFENPDFAIDTTAPQFKKTEAMDKLMQERRRRYNADTSEEKSRKKRKTDSKPTEQNVDALINKLKRNAKK
ncbi:hypothetical protein TRICI_001924 [Trichomonascus ciferrii]|uniref:Uncharacterized protein n=1 Tax=Trichomonascus ciferrii TaxID=44093 RepID=A0A642V744_9ASCO|nr:hypothetical protein TRICI_001924 [Trichomonascus ciferrii]